MGGDGEPLAEVVYVDLRELEGREELTHLSAERKSLLPAPRMYWTRQSAEGPGRPVGSDLGNTSYYRMRAEGLALRVEKELQTWQEWFGGGEPERLEVPGLDSFWWAGDEQPLPAGGPVPVRGGPAGKLRADVFLYRPHRTCGQRRPISPPCSPAE